MAIEISIGEYVVSVERKRGSVVTSDELDHVGDEMKLNARERGLRLTQILRELHSVSGLQVTVLLHGIQVSENAL